MKYRALTSFVGLESMSKGEVKELTNNDIISDLLNCGYIEMVEPDKKTVKKTVKGNKTK